MCIRDREIPLRGLNVRGFGQRHDADVARGEVLGDAHDGAVLAGAVAAFEDDEHLLAARDDVALEFDQLDLQVVQGFFVFFLAGHGGIIGTYGR